MLALLKLFHPSAFAHGFEMYELLARRWRLYGYLCPLIELTFGLGNGSVPDVPLSTGTLTKDVGMVALAAVMGWM